MKAIYSFILMLIAVLPSISHAQIADPTDVGNLVFWVDAQDVNGNGIQPNNGDAITTWVDKSSGSNNLSRVAGTITYEENGFDSVNPSLRFPTTAQMAGGNPFSSDVQDEITIFFVNQEVVRTANFSVSLNGTNTSSSSTDGRFSFHTPWSNGTIFFDAGGCCGDTRLEGATPNIIGETTLYTGLNDQPGSQQLLRVDGLPFRNDATSQNANVSRGINLGLLGSRVYNGRFAEIVIYDRALSLSEIQDVECYLLAKWKPSAALSGCISGLSATKTSAAIDTTGLGEFNIPENDVLYQIDVSKTAGAGFSNNSILVVDSLPDNVSFFNSDIDGSGPETNPISFTQTGSSLIFTYGTDVAFSDGATAPADFTDCAYIPDPGYDPDVRHICINPKGTMQGANSTSSFQIMFRARIQ